MASSLRQRFPFLYSCSRPPCACYYAMLLLMSPIVFFNAATVNVMPRTNFILRENESGYVCHYRVKHLSALLLPELCLVYYLC
ncbi:hypothetical protein FKM82_010058 [Ascaphus truei]